MNKVLISLIVASSLFLSGCFQTTVVKQKIIVATPSEGMYDCPLKKKFPNPDTITDVEVAKVLVELYSNNRRCYHSIQAIKAFLEKAKLEANKQ